MPDQDDIVPDGHKFFLVNFGDKINVFINISFQQPVFIIAFRVNGYFFSSVKQLGIGFIGKIVHITILPYFIFKNEMAALWEYPSILPTKKISIEKTKTEVPPKRILKANSFLF